MKNKTNIINNSLIKLFIIIIIIKPEFLLINIYY
jgi:hypothetical protein